MDTMQFLIELSYPLASTLNLPTELLILVALIISGLLGHFLIHHIVRRLSVVADKTNTRWDDVLVYSISPPAEWAMWVVLGYFSLTLFDEFKGARALLLQASDTGLIFLIGWLSHRLVRGIEEELLGEHRGPKASTDRATISAMARLTRIIFWTIAGIMILQSVGVSVSGLLAFGGVGGVAVGFAAKDFLANFLGGLSIYLDRPFAVGDWIRSPDRDIEGTVEDIGWRITRIRTFDQRPLYVPNAVFSTVAIENPSRMQNRRIYETIGLRYDDSLVIADIIGAVELMLRKHKDIAQDRTLIVNLVSFGPSSLDFFVYTFTKTTDWVTYHAVKQNVMLEIMGIVARYGAEVAFPTRKVLIEENKEAEDNGPRT